MSKTDVVTSRLRLLELMAALSLATDVGTGQPLEHALRTCLLALQAGEASGLSAIDRSTVLYATLLRFLGCTADASETTGMARGDEIAFNAPMAPVVMANDREAVPHLVRHLGGGLPLARRLGRIGAALADPGGKARSLSAHCEVGARLAARIGLPPDVTTAVAHGYERWDGKGLPDGLAGGEVPVAVRVAVVARDVDVWFAKPGWEATAEMIRRRRGFAYEPRVADVFVAHGFGWLEQLERLDPWDAVLAAEPAPIAEIGTDQLDDVLVTFADFTDLKSPWFAGHSRAVSQLARAAAPACGLHAEEVARAGLVHDLGVVGVPAGVWNRTGPLTSEGWERVRLHPQLGGRILARCAALADLASDASAHHERADGSGYHRGVCEIPRVAQLIGR